MSLYVIHSGDREFQVDRKLFRAVSLSANKKDQKVFSWVDKNICGPRLYSQTDCNCVSSKLSQLNLSPDVAVISNQRSIDRFFDWWTSSGCNWVASQWHQKKIEQNEHPLNTFSQLCCSSLLVFGSSAVLLFGCLFALVFCSTVPLLSCSSAWTSTRELEQNLPSNRRTSRRTWESPAEDHVTGDWRVLMPLWQAAFWQEPLNERR